LLEGQVHERRGQRWTVGADQDYTFRTATELRIDECLHPFTEIAFRLRNQGIPAANKLGKKGFSMGGCKNDYALSIYPGHSFHSVN